MNAIEAAIQGFAPKPPLGISAVPRSLGIRPLDTRADAPLLPVPPLDGAPPDDWDCDLAHPQAISTMTHIITDHGNAIHIHASRPTVTQLVFPEPLPFDDLLGARITTIRHVPAALQQDVSMALAGAISRYVLNPTLCNLFAFLSFQKLVLRAPKVSGRHSRETVTATLQRRIRTFQAGGIRSLWHDLQQEFFPHLLVT